MLNDSTQYIEGQLIRHILIAFSRDRAKQITLKTSFKKPKKDKFISILKKKFDKPEFPFNNLFRYFQHNKIHT